MTSLVEQERDLDVIVVGAGFAGIVALYRLREAGLRTRVIEAGSGVGGVWFWNRYPGARCDVESIDYSYSFSPELDQEWTWSERYSPQEEIEAYLNYVADKFDLRRDIQFDTRVVSAVFDEQVHRWTVTTEAGERFSATYCVLATGMLSEPNIPDVPGLDRFEGSVLHTARWQDDDVDLSGRIAVFGTGSSGIQVIPEVAQQAKALTVFQRTANYSLPADNGPIEPDKMKTIKATYPERRHKVRDTFFGNLLDVNPQSALEVDDAEREATFRERWTDGSFGVLLSYYDLLLDERANRTMADFLEKQVRLKVKDPQVAGDLVPRGYPAGTRRMCVDSNFYETFNRDNVTLVNTVKEPVVEVTATGVRTAEREFEVDKIILATGFDAFTGALSKIDIRGRDGVTFNERWANGPRAYLGLMVHGFPNLFIPTGPGSPSVLSNVVHSAEQHGMWVGQLLEYLGEQGVDYVEPTLEAEDQWVAHVAEIAAATLYPKANSWYMGANIPGKPRMFMAYLGGIKAYREHLEQIAGDGYPTLELREPRPASHQRVAHPDPGALRSSPDPAPRGPAV